MPNSNSADFKNKRVRYTRQTIVTSTFFQMPRFLTSGELAGNKLSNNARMLYTMLHDRHRVSVKNGWFDENGEVYIYFKREEMQAQLGVSENTVLKIMKELKTLLLVEEKKQGLNKPNRIYLLSPVIGNDEYPESYLGLEPYLEPEPCFEPQPHLEPIPEYSPNAEHAPEYACVSEPAKSATLEVQNLHFRTRNICTSEPAKNTTPEPANSAAQEPQILHPNHNKLNNNNFNDNKGSETATADIMDKNGTHCLTTEAANPPPVTNKNVPLNTIMEIYNQTCQRLPPILEISGRRRKHVSMQYKKYGIEGLKMLFDKASQSIFLCGGGERGWRADFDWLITPSNASKVLEGKYDNNAMPCANHFPYFIQSEGVLHSPHNAVSNGTTSSYRNKNGFNSMAALRQMLELEEIPENQRFQQFQRASNKVLTTPRADHARGLT